MDRRAAIAGVVGAGLVAGGVLALDPFEDRAIGCPFHELTGWYCPGCGATRATWLLLHGDLTGVLRHNLLFLPALAWLVARWVASALPARTTWLPGWVREPSAIPAAALRAAVVLVVVFAVARNLGPFDFLAPPTVGS